MPSFFQCSQSAPSASAYGLASIEPPSSAWQINGYAASSTNGPAGDAARATPTHCRFVAVERAA